MVSRKLESGRKAMLSISDGARDTSDHSGAVDLRFVECDFGDLRTVKTVADQLAEEEPRLDIVRHFYTSTLITSLKFCWNHVRSS